MIERSDSVISDALENIDALKISRRNKEKAEKDLSKPHSDCSKISSELQSELLKTESHFRNE